jgi:hypothetical protein
MTAGRVFMISAPTVGSRLMSQTSLRRIEVLAIERRKSGQLAPGAVIHEQGLGGCGELAAPVDPA